IGIAEGNIIATIMTTRRAKKSTRSDDTIVDGAISAIRKPEDVHVAYQAAATTRATAAATGIVTRRSRIAGPWRVASPIRPPGNARRRREGREGWKERNTVR